MLWDKTRDNLSLANKILIQSSTKNLHIFDNSLVIISLFAVPMKIKVHNNPSLNTSTSKIKNENTAQKVTQTNPPTMTSMNRNVQHLTQPVVNKNWFINLHAEKTSKTLNK